MLRWNSQQQADATQPVSHASSEGLHALWRAATTKLAVPMINYIDKHVASTSLLLADQLASALTVKQVRSRLTDDPQLSTAGFEFTSSPYV